MKRNELSEEHKELLNKYNISIKFIQKLIDETKCSLSIVIEF